MGMQEGGSNIVTQIIPDVKKPTLRAVVNANVEKGSVVSTDDLMSYGLLEDDGYVHGAVKHAAKEWTRYDYRQGVTHFTNSVEGFWRLFKASVRSTHIQISGKHMQRHLDDFTFHANHRERLNAMFDLMVGPL